MKKCSRCKLEKALLEFPKNRSTKDGLQHNCKPCHREASRQSYGRNKARHLAKHKAWLDKNPGYQQGLMMKRRYGITVEQYEQLLEIQGSRCAICGVHKDSTDQKLCVDHDHRHCPKDKGCPSCIRGIICSEDNMKLGKFEQEPDKMPIEFVAYILRHEGRRLKGRTVLDLVSSMSSLS